MNHYKPDRPHTLRAVAAALAAAGLLAVAGCGQRSAADSLAAAKTHLARNERPAAVIELKNALQAQPDLAEARLLLGTTLYAAEDYAGAAIELAKARDLGVSAEQVVPPLARAYLRTDQARKVVELDRTNALVQPEALADLKTTLTQAHAALGDEARADAAMADALRAKPDHAPARLLQARQRAGKGDLAAATSLVDAVLAAAPADTEALKLKAEIARAAGDDAGAIALFRRALEADPRDVEAHSALILHALSRGDVAGAGTSLEAMKKVRGGHLQTRYLEARLAAQKGEFATADEQAQALLKVAPEWVAALHLAGSLAMQRGELRLAEQHLGKVMQLAPSLVLPREQLARLYLRTGETDKARALLQPMLDVPSPRAETLALAGTAALIAGDTKQAEAYLAESVKLQPDDAGRRTALAVARIAGGQAGAGLAELEAIAAGDKGTAADYALISATMNRRDFDAALKAIDRLAQKEPGKPQPLHLRGQVLALRGDMAGARAALERALAADARFFPSIDALGAFDLREGKPAAARARFEALVQADPKHSRALLALANLDRRDGKAPDDVAAALGRAVAANPTDPAPRAALVQHHLGRRDADRAVTAAQEAATALPDNAGILALLGAAQMAAKQTQQAISSYNKLVAMQPKAPQPLLALAEAHAAAGAFEAATVAVDKAIALAPNLPVVYEIAARVELRAGRPAQAIARAKALQARLPKRPEGWVLEGDVAMSARDWAGAASAFRGAIERQGGSVSAQRLHTALRATGDMPRADAFAAEWLKSNPRDGLFRFHLAGLAIAAKRYDAAVSELEQVLKIAPDNAAALNNLAWVLATQGKAGALEPAERANRLAPNEPAFIDTLALALAANGKPAEAVAAQKRALQLAPPDAHALRLGLARYQLQAGDKAAARKELEALSALGDKFHDQGQVRELMTKL